MMDKKNYDTPNMVVFNLEHEDVICNSADTDAPFLPVNEDVF